MNTKRILFWLGFVVILGLISWGLVAAQKRSTTAGTYGTPPAVTAADHVEGPADAKNTLIEYGDFQCPACAAYAPIVEQIASEDATATGTLRIVFRYFPLPQHKNALVSAAAAQAASNQGKFWEMYKILYANQTSWQDDANADAQKVFVGYAGQLGMDTAHFTTDMNSSSTAAVVQAGLAEATSLGLDYTPTFYLNGKVITNPQGYAPFKALIEAAK